MNPAKARSSGSLPLRFMLRTVFHPLGSACLVCRIIEWDGTRWQAMPGDLLEADGYGSEIDILIYYDNDLHVGGSFATAAGPDIPRIARWRGFRWEPVGHGFGSNVFAAVQWKESLVVGGDFRRSGEQELVGIARWGPEETSLLDTIEFPTHP